MNILSSLFEPVLKMLPYPLRNRYGITLMVFLVLMIFIDNNNVMTQFRLSKTVSNMEFEKEYYQEEIATIKNQEEDLSKDIEKFAREHYHMKKANEDVFVIVRN